MWRWVKLAWLIAVFFRFFCVTLHCKNINDKKIGFYEHYYIRY